MKSCPRHWQVSAGSTYQGSRARPARPRSIPRTRLADCIGGVRFPRHAFAVGEAVGIDEFPIGPFMLEVDAHAEIAAHELGHLMGAHHHYANCVEGNLQGEANDLSPCTLMFNFVDFQSLNFSQVNDKVVRGHAVNYASP